MQTKRCTKCKTTKPFIEFNKGGYHCRQCRNAYIKEWKRKNKEKIVVKVEKICIVCDKTFIAQESWGQTRNTCSNKCRYELTSKKLSNKVSRNCKQCGQSFVVTPGSQKVCCSAACRKNYMSNLLRGNKNPNWKETKTIRPSSKRSLRNRIKERDKICQDCGSKKYLQVHHKDSDPGNNNEDNLILLCKICHSIRHEQMGESSLIGLILANRTYSKLKERKCAICDIIFQPKREKTCCCSAKCAAKLSGLNRRATKP